MTFQTVEVQNGKEIFYTWTNYGEYLNHIQQVKDAAAKSADHLLFDRNRTLAPATCDSQSICPCLPVDEPKSLHGSQTKNGLLNNAFERQVESVIGSCIVGRQLWYLTKWKGFGEASISWEEGSSVHARQQVEQFQRDFGRVTAQNPTILSPAGLIWQASNVQQHLSPSQPSKPASLFSVQPTAAPTVGLSVVLKKIPGTVLHRRLYSRACKRKPPGHPGHRQYGLTVSRDVIPAPLERLEKRHAEEIGDKAKSRRGYTRGQISQSRRESLRQGALKRWAKWRAEGRTISLFGSGELTREQLSGYLRQQALKRWERFRADGTAEKLIEKMRAGQRAARDRRMALGQMDKTVSVGRTCSRRQTTLSREEDTYSTTETVPVMASDDVKPEAMEEEEEFEVERVIGAQKIGRNIYYLTKWEGYDDTHNIWQNAPDMTQARKAVLEFVSNFGKVSAANPRILSPEGLLWTNGKSEAGWPDKSDKPAVFPAKDE